MNNKQFVNELLNQFLLSDESNALTKLDTIKTYCTSVIEGGKSYSNEWGKGYRQGTKDFAESILEYLKDD